MTAQLKQLKNNVFTFNIPAFTACHCSIVCIHIGMLEQLLAMLFLPVSDWLASSIGVEQLGKVWGQEPSWAGGSAVVPLGVFDAIAHTVLICFLSVVSFSHPSNRVAVPVCLRPRADTLFARCFLCLWQLCSIWWRLMETVLKKSI